MQDGNIENKSIRPDLKDYITSLISSLNHFMKLYNRFLVKPTDQFNPDSFSSVNEEIAAINGQTEHLSVVFKPEIIVCFARDHSLQNEWIQVNPELTNLVTSGSLFTGSIEALFESCRNNPSFRKDLEIFLTEKFTGHLSRTTE
jgi:hypothetical protein